MEDALEVKGPADGTYRRSNYNYYIDRPEGIVGFNARSGVFAKLSSEVAEFMKGDRPIEPGAFGGQAELLEMGFLHRGDELDRVTERYQNARGGARKMQLTLVPTMACNFTCDYCYQNEYRRDSVMSPETQDAAVRYVRSIVEAGTREVVCTWYGGEPLLCAPIVVGLTRRLADVVGSAGGAWGPVSIITNGTLLSEPLAVELREVGIRRVQVSFDALRYDGRTKRGVLDAEDKPSVILRNLITARPHLNLSIRINVSRDNQPEVPRILAVLRDHGLADLAYLARVSDLDGEVGCTTNEQGHRAKAPQSLLPIIQPGAEPLTRAKFAEYEWSINLEKPEGLRSMINRLKPKSHFCAATSNNLFVIDPDGDISRCWHSAGSPGEAMGNVHDTEVDVEESEVAKRWRAYTPFRYPSCSTCQVLPLCMGGCSHPRLFMDAKKPPCESIKYQIEACVNEVGNRIKL